MGIRLGVPGPNRIFLCRVPCHAFLKQVGPFGPMIVSRPFRGVTYNCLVVIFRRTAYYDFSIPHNHVLSTQTFQNPLFKEYTLHHSRILNMI